MDTINVLGSIASLIGLGISVAILFYTKGAKEAAREARDLTYGKNILTELREITREFEKISSEIERGIRINVILHITSCSQKLNYFKGKWAPELKNRNNISYAGSDIEILLEELNNNDCQSLEKDEVFMARNTLTKVLKYLNAELGHFDRKIS